MAVKKKIRPITGVSISNADRRMIDCGHTMKIEPGEIVIAVLHSPREKVLGILDEISPAGVFIRGVELGYFDDWTRAIASGEPHLPMVDHFFPMWRVERMSLDASSDDMRSMAQQFYERTGKEIGQF